MEIKTGEGTIPLVTLIGIWSISALNALPGLAVSPILGQLSQIFPHATELDIQMLTSLPSLLIIPFILLSGTLTERVNNIRLLQIGLGIFAASGVLYLLSDRMWQLIAVSALLGAGSGLIVPSSTGFITRFFKGSYRVKQFGLSSAITNITLVIATVITGYLAEVDWHLPFIVYLLPIISIFLSSYLREASGTTKKISESNRTSAIVAGKQSDTGDFINRKRLVQLMAFYGLCTYLVIIVSFNLPFLMEEYHFSSGNSGIMISLFFLAIMTPGLFLNQIIGWWKQRTEFYSLLCIAVGLGLIILSRSEWWIGSGCLFAGFGYGVIQPVVYDKTTRTASSRKVTLALAFVMAMNYLAILLCPFIIDWAGFIFRVHTQQFAFIFNLVVTVLAAGWAYWKRNSFVFSGNTEE